MDTRHDNVGSDADLLRGLLEGDPTFPFTTIKDLEGATRYFRDQGQGECLAFTGVSQNTFQQLGNNRSSALYHARLLYIHNLKTLRVKMASLAHDTAASTFAEILALKFNDMGAYDKITSSGSGRIHIENVDKQPDACWGPSDKAYLTCVLEVGLSDTQRKLDIIARIWLEKPESPQSHVHQMVTIKITSDQARIVFRKWEKSTRELNTRSSHPARAKMIEEAKVFMDGNDIKVEGSLSLSFEKLVEQVPAPGTLEREEIRFTETDLTAIARRVWGRQGLI